MICKNLNFQGESRGFTETPNIKQAMKGLPLQNEGLLLVWWCFLVKGVNLLASPWVQQSVTVERGAWDQSSNLGSGVYNRLASDWSCWRSLVLGHGCHPRPARQPTQGWSWWAAFPRPEISVQTIFWRCLLSVIFYVKPQQVRMCFLVSQSIHLWGLTVLCEPKPTRACGSTEQPPSQAHSIRGWLWK